MKKNLGLIVGVIAIGVLAYFTYTLLSDKEDPKDQLSDSDAAKIVTINGQKRLGKTERIKFAIADTGAVDKIVITKPNGDRIQLRKKNEEWMAQNMIYEKNKWVLKNKEFKARQDAINIILKTFKTIELKEWVPSTAHDNVMKNMKVTNTQVDIFKNGKLHKVWYIGNATADHYGTQMLLEKEGIQSPEVVVMTAKGFNGHLTSRFFTDPDEWLHRGLWEVQPEEIAKIEWESYDMPSENFTLEYGGDDDFTIKNREGQIQEIRNMSRPRDFILGFKRLFFEQMAKSLDDYEVDSVRQSKALIRIKTTFTNGSDREIIAYRIKEAPGATNMAGQPIEWNPDRLYAFVNGKGVYIIQYHNFNTVFKPLSYLIGDFEKK